MVKEIIINNRVSEITRVSCFIEEVGVSLNIPAKITMGVDLAMEEIILNIIQCAYQEEQHSYIQLQIQIDSGKLTFQVVHEGKALNLLKRVVSNLPEEQLNSGRSTYLIHRTMDEVSYQTINSQNQLTLVKRIDDALKPSATLNTNICRIDGITVLAIEGRLNTANAIDFSAAIEPLLQEDNSNIIINCVNMTYISSSGLRCFLMLQKHVQKNQGTLVVEGLTPEIRHIFDMTGWASLFTIL